VEAKTGDILVVRSSKEDSPVTKVVTGGIVKWTMGVIAALIVSGISFMISDIYAGIRRADESRVAIGVLRAEYEGKYEKLEQRLSLETAQINAKLDAIHELLAAHMNESIGQKPKRH
jgi:hypothetical protein